MERKKDACSNTQGNRKTINKANIWIWLKYEELKVETITNYCLSRAGDSDQLSQNQNSENQHSQNCRL